MSDQNISESSIIRAEDEPVINLHTVFVALYPLLGLYAHNLDKTPVAGLVRPIIAVVVFSWLVTFILRRVMGDRDKGAAAATVIVAAIFSGWSILLFLIAILLPSFSGYPDWIYYAAYTVFFIVVAAYLTTRAHGKVLRTLFTTAIGLALVLLLADGVLSAIVPRGHAWFMVGYAVLTGGIIYWIKNSDRDFRQLTITLNWFGAILIGISILNIFYNRPEDATTPAPEPLAEMPALTEDADHPDIYCIVVGGRGGASVNEGIYGVSDDAFTEALSEYGIEMVPRTIANYPNQLFSLASCLNMDYLQNLPKGDALTSAAVADLYHHNRVIEFLRAHGYTIVVGAPSSELLAPRETVDESILPDRSLSEFEIVLLENSALSPIARAYHFLRHGSVAEIGHIAEHGRVYQMFDRISSMPSEGSDRPRFLLAVMPIPEAPFVFDSEGNWPDSTGIRTYAGQTEFTGDSESYKANYVEQLAFTDAAVLNTIQRIAEDAKRPAIVIVMSAHGPSSTLVEDKRRLDLRERFTTFLAVGAVGDEQRDLNLPDQMSLVNLFRYILNESFDASLPTLDDEVYLIHGDAPVKFEALTRPPQ